MRELRPWIRLLFTRQWRLWAAASLMLATLLSGVGLLSLSGWFITATAVTAMAWAAGMAATLDVYIPGGGIRFFALTRTVSRYFERLYNHDTVLRLLADLRVTLFRALSQLDGQTQSRYRAAQWLNRLTRDIDTLDNLFLRLLAPPAVALLGALAVSLLIGLFLLPAGILLFLLLLGVLCFATAGMALWGRQLSGKQVLSTDHVRSRAIEQMQGLAELSAWRVLAAHQRDLLTLENERSNDRFRLDCRSACGQAMAQAGVQIGVFLVLVMAVGAYQQQVLNGPLMVMMPLAVLAVNEGFAGLPAAFMHWGSTEAAARRLNEQRDLQSILLNPSHPQPIAPSASIHYQNVVVRHGATTVFNGLNLTLSAGEKLAIVGPSGAGKSTLAALTARLIDPTSGSAMVGTTPLTDIDLTQWRTHTAVLSQDAHIFNGTLAENLYIANPEATEAQLWNALEQVAMADTVRSFRDGLNTQLGEFGRQLSGGEARRIALARLFLREPHLVILDEPLTGLDEKTAAHVIEHLNNFLTNRTALLLGHELVALPHSDRVLVLASNGKLTHQT